MFSHARRCLIAHTPLHSNNCSAQMLREFISQVCPELIFRRVAQAPCAPVELLRRQRACRTVPSATRYKNFGGRTRSSGMINFSHFSAENAQLEVKRSNCHHYSCLIAFCSSEKVLLHYTPWRRGACQHPGVGPVTSSGHHYSLSVLNEPVAFRGPGFHSHKVVSNDCRRNWKSRPLQGRSLMDGAYTTTLDKAQHTHLTVEGRRVTT